MPAPAVQPPADPEPEGSSPQSNQKPNLFSRIWTAIRGGSNQDIGPPRDVFEHPLNAQPGLRNLRDMRVEDVMVPKADIVAVSVDISKSDLIDTFQSKGLTRLPVYEETLDTPLGFLHLKDLALRHGFGSNSTKMQVREMLRPLLFVPPSMPIGVLLAKMQADRVHLALVIDEYGGTDGLVSIEDLIEQVIGEIEDEHDVDEDEYFVEEKPGCYLALAKTPLEAFEAAIGINLTDFEDIDREEIDSLGGLVFMLAGHVPVRSEVVSHPAGIEFEILEADPRRIKRLRAYVQHNASA